MAAGQGRSAHAEGSAQAEVAPWKVKGYRRFCIDGKGGCRKEFVVWLWHCGTVAWMYAPFAESQTWTHLTVKANECPCWNGLPHFMDVCRLYLWLFLLDDALSNTHHPEPDGVT
jgi:hypothetical protein